MIHTVRCGRCSAKGTIRAPLRSGASATRTCPVCLGLGTYQESDRWKRPEGPPDGFMTLHSDVPIADVIALLPIKEER